MAQTDEVIEKAQVPEQRVADPIVRYFEFGHLPPHLAEVGRVFHATATWVEQNLPRSAERTVALRKLLEGKDAAVRTLV